MALSKKDLQAISDLMDIKLGPITKDVALLKTDVAELKSDVAELKSDVSKLKDTVARLETDVAVLKSDMAELKATVNKNHDMLVEFYGKQMEFNITVNQRFEHFDARIIILEHQQRRRFMDPRRQKNYK